jgi:CBS domain-containing protein
MKAKQIMTTNLATVTETATLRDVISLMLERNISGIPVLNEDGLLIGIVSESDVIRLRRKLHMPDYIQLLETLLNNANPDEFDTTVSHSLDLPVTTFMTRKLITANEEAGMAEITRLMVEHSINRIPILRGKTIVGIVTRRDAIRAMAGIGQKI